MALVSFGNATSDPCASEQGLGVEIFGWVGAVAAWLLFLAPLPTMRKIHRAKSTGDFSAVPYLVSAMNCGLWTVYAAVTPCKLQPFVTNVVGGLLEVCYVIIFIWRAPTRKRRSCMVMAMLAVVLTLVALSAFAIYVAPELPIKPWPVENPPITKKTTVLGLFAIAFNIAMYASPLSIMRTVLRTRSVAAMPLALTIGCGLCSGCWFAYALLVGDDFILVPNAAGLALFVVQLAVYRSASPFCVCTTRSRRSRAPESPKSLSGAASAREALLGVSDEVPALGLSSDRLALPRGASAAAGGGLVSPVADIEGVDGVVGGGAGSATLDGSGGAGAGAGAGALKSLRLA
jgi:solute carrier family 50 protein (sugar transporter)